MNSNLQIQQTETIHTKQDCIVNAAVSCQYGIFLGDMLLANEHRFKIFKLKRDHVPHAIKFYDQETTKTSDEAHTCQGWYRYALSKGYFQTMEQVFPKMFWSYDFDVYDITYEVNKLTKRLDALDLVNALDSEVTSAFVEQLQNGGDAFALVEAKVAAEAVLRTNDDDAQKTRLTLIEAAGWVTTARVQDSQVTFAKCASDVCSKAQLDLESALSVWGF